jgi:hypothetical protein
MVRYSFLVRLSHPLLHAGLSRRLFESLPADSALAATFTLLFWARLVSHRSGLFFCPVEDPVMLEA